MNFSLEKSLDVLQRTPPTLHALLAGLSEFWTQNNYGEKTFSPFDVVGHLIHAERTNWMARLRTILDWGEAKLFPPFDRYAMYEASKGKTIPELLETFATLRANNLADLRGLQLTEAQLDMRGTHPDFGPVTARQLIATWVVHDLNHLHQIAKSMAFQYRDDVGPWRAFLSILPNT
jgi:DinB family protein